MVRGRFTSEEKQGQTMAVNKNLTIAVVGTGIGGTELAGYLGLAGFRVRVHDIRPEAVDGMRAHHGLEVEGVLNGFAPIEHATTNLAEAIAGANLIAVTTLNNHHQAVAREIAPLLKDRQAICLMPGYIGGSLAFRSALEHIGCRAQILVGEIDNFPFTGRILEPARLHLASIKKRLLVAGFPKANGTKLMDLIQPLFPQAVLASNVLQTSLSTMNPVMHVPGMLANAARIDAGQPFQFYGEGISQNVARLIETLDNERIAVAQAFGVSVLSQREWLYESYRLTGGNLYELVQRLHWEIFKDSPAPDRLDHRYVAEDVPYGLVPLAALGQLAGLAMPVVETLITMASVMLASDFRSSGRTIERMGLDGLDIQAIRSRVEH
jgi:opine dehydrogenase